MTKNERIIIDKLKENEDFKYLITQPVDNITIGNTSRAVKGLSSNYIADPDGTIQYLLKLVSLNCYLGPILSEDVLLKPEEIEDAVRACINNYFMIICLDKIITKYKTHPESGFSTEHTWRESQSDFVWTKFFMDSNNKSLRFEIGLESPELIKKMSISEFRQSARIVTYMNDAQTGKQYMGLRGLFNNIDNILKYLLNNLNI